MELEKIIKNLKYVPKIWMAFSYPILLIIALLLFFGRNFPNLQIKPLLSVLPNFYSHVSNFSISLIIYTTMGYVGVMIGLTTKHLIILVAFIALVNLITESFVSILNTPDITDAVYGIFGGLFGLIYICIAKKKGLKINEL